MDPLRGVEPRGKLRWLEQRRDSHSMLKKRKAELKLDGNSLNEPSNLKKQE